jgi:hypothetical protein
MNKVLIVITSYRSKSDRVYKGSEEWPDGWRFSKLENYKLRTKNMSKPKTVKTMSELAPLVDGEDTIIWIRVKDPQKIPFPKVEIGKLITSLKQTSDVYVTHHDEFVGDELASVMGRSRDHFRPYTLSSGANPEGFKAILKVDDMGEHYLDAEANFNEIFGSFFLDPTDVFGLVEHKIIGSLSAIDMDLQTYQYGKAWNQLVEVYKGSGATRKLNECQAVFYKNAVSLKRLYDSERVLMPDKRKLELEERWKQLTRLFPETGTTGSGSVHRLYAKVATVIEGLDQGVEDKVATNFESGNTFREWLDRIRQAIEEIQEVIMADNTQPVGA